MGLRGLLNHWLARRADAPNEAQAGDDGSRPATAAAHADAESWYRKAAEHLAAGRLLEAEQALSRALNCRHDFAEALVLQSLVYRKQGRLEDATDSLLLARHFRPDFAEAHFQLGLIAASQGRSDEAERCYRQAVEDDSGHAKAQNALGAALVARGSLEEAVECFHRAIASRPDFASAHSNLGCVLITRLDRFDEGAQFIEKAWTLAPGDRDVMCNWALLLQYRGHLAEALELCDRLIANDASEDTARLNRALALLKQGDFARGWTDYEARKSIAWAYAPRQFPFPEWKGEPLTGRNVLVHGEQGLGDQIMFASCLPDLARLAEHCVVECNPKLEALFRRSFPGMTVVTTEEIAAGEQWLKRVPGIDCQVAIGSLPQYFRKSLAQFPAHDGYLRADPEKVAAWRRRLAELPGVRRVGISWRGGMKSSRQSVRSMTLDQWLPVFRLDDVAFVSLQYTDCRDELEQVERDHGIRIHYWQEAIDDYDETAALVCALDLVISVQTAIVHLAGALGRRVWVMVPSVAEWRYLQSGERIPWYPLVRPWRQDRPGEWASVVEAVASELLRLAAPLRD